MATYTTDALVMRALGLTDAGMPSGLDTSAERAGFLTSAVEFVHAALYPAIALGTYDDATQMFPDTDDDPATPMIIQILTSYYAAALVTDAMYMAQKIDPKKAVNRYWDRAEEMARQIRDGELVVVDSAGTAYARSAIAGSTSNASAVPTFRIGQRDEDGNLVDEGGTLDSYGVC